MNVKSISIVMLFLYSIRNALRKRYEFNCFSLQLIVAPATKMRTTGSPKRHSGLVQK